jgi:hypothetical protein
VYNTKKSSVKNGRGYNARGGSKIQSLRKAKENKENMI